MKTHFTIKSIYLFALVLFSFIACKDDDPDNLLQGILNAKAGTDQTVQTGQTVTLDGSASTDSQHKPFTYQWAFSKKPTSSMASLQTATTSAATFVADAAGEYEVELSIANENGVSKDLVLITAIAAQAIVLPEFITTATVLEDRIADPAIPDYYANTNVTVSAALSLKPGVTIAFAADTRMEIAEEGGVIIAKGSADKKIRFTGKEAANAYWRGLMIYSASSQNELDHIEIAYAGNYGMLGNIKAGLTLFGISKAQVSVKNSLFHQNGGYGIHAASGSVLQDFSNNTFSHNAEAGILLAADNVPKLDAASVFTNNNGRNRVEVLASNIGEAGTATEAVWAGFADQTPYYILGELRVNSGWKLLPGVMIEAGPDQVLVIESTGYLNAVGTASNRISITGAVKTPGYWRGISFGSASALNVLEHTEIAHGGSYQLVSGKKANIALLGENAKVTIRNSDISHSAGWGIYVRYNTSINDDVQTANTFTGNAAGDLADENSSDAGSVPAQLVGKWQMGHFSMGEFWTYDGTLVGNAFELAVAFDFKANGSLEFYFVSGGTSAGCRTEAFVYKKGTVKFNENASFTFTPTEGSTKGFYKGCAPSYQNYNRNYEKNELKPETYYYEIETGTDGKKQLVIRFNPTDANASYFQASSW